MEKKFCLTNLKEIRQLKIEKYTVTAHKILQNIISEHKPY